MFREVRPKWPGVVTMATIIVAGALVALAGCRRGSVDDLLAAGDAALQTTKVQEAEQNYEKAAKIAPNDVRVHVALGNLYVFEHKQGQAQLEFMKVIELDPKNPAAHVALANLYMDEAQFPLAENQYRGAIALDETRANYRVDIGKVLIKENKPTAAEDEFRTAIGLDPKNAQAHFELAKLLASQPNRKAEADSEFEQAHALDPKLAPAGTPTAVASAPEAATKPSIKQLNKIFLLTHDSAVYQSPDSASATIAKVRRKKYVHVVGITGDWLQIKLRNGTTGFIPTSAAQ